MVCILYRCIDPIPVFCDRLIGDCLVQRDIIIETRRCCRELSRRHFSAGAPPLCRPQSSCGGEVCHLYNGSNVVVQHCGECIADRAENSGVIFRPCALVQPVQRPENFIGLGHRHASGR